MSKPNQSPSPFEGKIASNSQEELFLSRIFVINEAEQIADQTFYSAYPEVYALYQSDNVQPQLEQPIDYNHSQPIYIAPASPVAENSVTTQPQSTEILDINAIRAEILNIPDDTTGIQDDAA
jgi:hypothetical protein